MSADLSATAQQLSLDQPTMLRYTEDEVRFYIAHRLDQSARVIAKFTK